MTDLIPQWSDKPLHVGAISTCRSGGVSAAPYDDGQGGGGLNLGIHVGDDPAAVRRNRLLLAKHLPSEPVWLTQVHGNRVVDAATVVDVPEADASFTTQPGVVCAILTADCMPVLFCDSAAKVVGAAHAGWRGLAAGVLENTVAAMRQAGATQLQAWIGPAIGPHQFEVGEEVLAAFARLGSESDAAFRPIAGRAGKYLADLPQLARWRLALAGVQQVSGGTACTVSDAQRFYSFRRDQVTGRMASLIWLK